MRKFKLTNAHGETFDLMRRDALLWEPEGMGFAYDLEALPSGAVWIETKKNEAQPTVTGSMVFGGYAQADEFRRFCRVGGLVLGYMPQDEWWYMECVPAVERGEIEYETRKLICPVTFTGLSSWYKSVKTYNASMTEETGGTYPYTYPYTYGSGALGTVEITNGEMDSYSRITIIGPVTNPQWALYQSGAQIASGKVTATISSGHRLVIDSNPAKMQISETDGTGTILQSLWDSSDFETERFIIVPPGLSTMLFTQSGTGAVEASVEVQARV